MRQTGIVKWYRYQQGIGFVTTKIDGEETDNVLIHYSELKNDIRLDTGQEIEFSLLTTERGHYARDIELIAKENNK